MSTAVFVTPAKAALKVTALLALTDECLIVNVTVVAPLGTVTGLVALAAAESELVSVTVIPPLGAAPVKVSFAVTVVPELPFTVVGASVKLAKAAA